MKRVILAGCLSILVFGCAAVAGCGSSGEDSIQGVYKLKATEDFVATVTLKAGNKATYSITEGAGVPVTYEVKGDTVVLIGLDGKEIPSATFKVTDKGLTDPQGNVYEKQ